MRCVAKSQVWFFIASTFEWFFFFQFWCQSHLHLFGTSVYISSLQPGTKILISFVVKAFLGRSLKSQCCTAMGLWSKVNESNEFVLIQGHALNRLTLEVPRNLNRSQGPPKRLWNTDISSSSDKTPFVAKSSNYQIYLTRTPNATISPTWSQLASLLRVTVTLGFVLPHEPGCKLLSTLRYSQLSRMAALIKPSVHVTRPWLTGNPLSE